MVICIVVLMLLVTGGECAKCVTDSPCRCTFDDGSGSIDISSLGNINGTARFRDVAELEGKQSCSYNPCLPFNEGSCTGVAVCLQDRAGSYIPIGKQKGAQFVTDDHSIIRLRYPSGAPVIIKETYVHLICKETQTEPTLFCAGKQNSSYLLVLRSRCACRGLCHAADVAKTGISIGTVLIIIFPTSLMLYFVTGISYNRFRRKLNGTEQIPHKDFWFGLPGSIKEGVLFTRSLLVRRRGYSRF